MITLGDEARKKQRRLVDCLFVSLKFAKTCNYNAVDYRFFLIHSLINNILSDDVTAKKSMDHNISIYTFCSSRESRLGYGVSTLAQKILF